MGGRIKVPKDVYILMPRSCEYVTLHGKRNFADVMKVADLSFAESGKGCDRKGNQRASNNEKDLVCSCWF